MNGLDVYILSGVLRQSMTEQLKFELNIDKALKVVTAILL